MTKTKAVQNDSSGMYEASGENLATMDSTKLDAGKEAERLALESQTAEQARDSAKQDTKGNAQNTELATKQDVKNQDTVDEQKLKTEEKKDAQQEKHDEKEAETEEKKEVVSSASSTVSSA